jgi:hypothetical protein
MIASTIRFIALVAVVVLILFALSRLPLAQIFSSVSTGPNPCDNGQSMISNGAHFTCVPQPGP